MMDRSPYDGRPYYCAVCGLGIAEYVACEDSICVLESSRTAAARAAQAGEAGTAATTKIGAVHEHAVPEGDAPNG